MISYQEVEPVRRGKRPADLPVVEILIPSEAVCPTCGHVGADGGTLRGLLRRLRCKKCGVRFLGRYRDGVERDGRANRNRQVPIVEYETSGDVICPHCSISGRKKTCGRNSDGLTYMRCLSCRRSFLGAYVGDGYRKRAPKDPMKVMFGTGPIGTTREITDDEASLLRDWLRDLRDTDSNCVEVYDVRTARRLGDTGVCRIDRDKVIFNEKIARRLLKGYEARKGKF